MKDQIEAGITPNIDGCRAMVVKHALRAFNKLPEQDKRWMGPDDYVQNGLMAALTVEQNFREGRGAKFSTYLTQGLKWHYATAVHTRYEAFKQSGIITELDAPVGRSEDSVTSEADTLPDTNGVLPGAVLNVYKTFLTLCREVSQEAVVALVKGLLFGEQRVPAPEVCDEIRQVSAKLHIGINDLRVGILSEKDRRNLLTLISLKVIMTVDTEERIRCLECIECKGTFSIAAVRHSRFFPSCMTCFTCLREMQSLPPAASCFGKVKTAEHEGYSAKDVECRLHCQDRFACRQLIQIETKERYMGTNSKTAEEAVEGVDFSDVETKSKDAAKAEPKKAKTAKSTDKKNGNGKAAKAEPKAAAKTEKTEKKVAKSAKAEADAPPPEIKKWPYKQGSIALYVFTKMLEGVDKKAIEKKVVDGGYGWKLILTQMRRANHKNHSWRLSEEGKTYKLYDVKWTGKHSKAKKAAAETE